MTARKTLVGLTFGKLKVIADAPPSATGKSKSVCVCECGKETTVFNGAITSGHTKSCGCLPFENTSRLTHGHARRAGFSKVYRCWQNMITRCYRPSSHSFQYYSRKNITVCERWRNSFQHFLEDMGTGKAGWTIERINNFGNYELENICWATRIRQARNTSANVVLTVRGITACVAELSEHFNIKASIVYRRLYRGREPEAAFLTKPKLRITGDNQRAPLACSLREG